MHPARAVALGTVVESQNFVPMASERYRSINDLRAPAAQIYPRLRYYIGDKPGMPRELVPEAVSTLFVESGL
jgi:hypothetical protein